MDSPDSDSDLTEPVPTNHRRAGRARLGRAEYEHEPPILAGEFHQNFRLVLLSILGPAALILGGGGVVVADGYTSAQRVGGAALACIGLLVLASYLIRFTTALSGEGWARTRVRRGARLVVRYSWHTYLTLLGLGAAYLVVVGLIDR